MAGKEGAVEVAPGTAKIGGATLKALCQCADSYGGRYAFDGIHVEHDRIEVADGRCLIRIRLDKSNELGEPATFRVQGRLPLGTKEAVSLNRQNGKLLAEQGNTTFAYVQADVPWPDTDEVMRQYGDKPLIELCFNPEPMRQVLKVLSMVHGRRLDRCVRLTVYGDGKGPIFLNTLPFEDDDTSAVAVVAPVYMEDRKEDQCH